MPASLRLQSSGGRSFTKPSRPVVLTLFFSFEAEASSSSEAACRALKSSASAICVRNHRSCTRDSCTANGSTPASVAACRGGSPL